MQKCWRSLSKKWRLRVQSLSEDVRVTFLTNIRTICIVAVIRREREGFSFMMNVIDTNTFLPGGILGTGNRKVDFVVHGLLPFCRIFSKINRL